MPQYDKDIDCATKFNVIPEIIRDWISPYINLDNATIMDFGCGNAITAVSLAIKYPNARVYAIDIQTSEEICLMSGISDYGITCLPNNLTIIQIMPNQPIGFSFKFDLIYSWSVLEHISQDILVDTLRQLRDSIKINGYMLTQIAPLYYSPFGSHVYNFIKEPWAHLTMQHNLFLHKLSEACPDTQTYDHLYSTYSTLNKITASKLEHILNDISFIKIREYFSTNRDYPKLDACDSKDISDLSNIYNKDILLTEQLVYLHKREHGKAVSSSNYKIKSKLFRAFKKIYHKIRSRASRLY